MKKTEYSDGMLVTEQHLDHTENARIEQAEILIEGMLATEGSTKQFGVFGNPLTSTQLKIVVSAGQLDISPGKGITKDYNLLWVESDPSNPNDNGPARPARQNLTPSNTTSGNKYIYIDYAEIAQGYPVYTSYDIEILTTINGGNGIYLGYAYWNGTSWSGAVTDLRSFISTQTAASSVTIADAGSTITATDVEAALQEIFAEHLAGGQHGAINCTSLTRASAAGIGVSSISSSSFGVYGESSALTGNGISIGGVTGKSTGTGAHGVYGECTTGITAGVHGRNSGGKFGVFGAFDASIPSVPDAGVCGSGGTNVGVAGAATSNYAVYGTNASSTYAAVYGINTSGFGVKGDGAAGGVYGTSASGGGPGIKGEVTSGSDYGVYGIGITGAGVYGISSGTHGVMGVGGTSGAGIYGTTSSVSNPGVYGFGSANDGVWGTSTSGKGVIGTSSSSYGVQGISTSLAGVRGESSNKHGVSGTTTMASSQHAGVYGTAVNAIGVFGTSTNQAGVVGYSSGSTGVYGYTASGRGVRGEGTTQGVYGMTTGSGATDAGVYGEAANAAGVYGKSTNASGVYADSINSYGIYATSTGDHAIYAFGASSSDAAVYATTAVGLYGVYGRNTGTSGTRYGVYAQSNSTGVGAIGVYGVATLGVGGRFQPSILLVPNTGDPVYRGPGVIYIDNSGAEITEVHYCGSGGSQLYTFNLTTDGSY